MSKKLGKNIAAFDYIGKTLIVSSARSGGVSIVSFASVIGTPPGIASASFTVLFSLTTGIIKKLLSITKNKKKKRNKIFMLTKTKLNSTENLISQALVDLEISHKEFKTNVKERRKYEKLKKVIEMMKSSDELGENNKNMSKYSGNANN